MVALRDRIRREEWNIGFIAQTAADIVARGIVQPPLWLPSDGPWRMLADPACRAGTDGSLFVMAERLDYWVGRGEIWSSLLHAGDDPLRAQFRPWLRSNKHLSFPFPLVGNDGARYLTVECWESGGLGLWRMCGEDPVFLGVVIEGPVVDAALWCARDTWWCFCTFQDDAPNERLHLFHAPRLEGPWRPHRHNPVKCDAGSSRSAGPLFVAGGRLIRPAQDCARTYGGAVSLNAVTRLDESGFAEEVLRRLTPFPEYPDGLHSFCPAGEWTLIDGKRWDFRALDLLRKVVVRRRAERRLPASFEWCRDEAAGPG